MSVRLLLVDDHAMVRSGVRTELSTDPRIEIVGEAADVESAIAQVHALHPDVVLLDVHLPGGTVRPGPRRCCSAAPICSRSTPARRRCGSWPCRSPMPPRT